MQRVFVLGGEYSSRPEALPLDLDLDVRAARAYADSGPLWERESTRAFFRYPRSSSAWRDLGRVAPVGLADLLASASHRALCSLGDRLGSHDEATSVISDLMVTTMPGIAPDEPMSPAMVPQTLRALLDLPQDCRCQLVVGTSDSGAWAFANAVRTARATPTTILVTAGQLIPPGYAAQQRIRTVLGVRDQAAGLDMLAVGDLLLDVLRRAQGGSADELRGALALIRQSKLAAAQRYPAALRAGDDVQEGVPMTPYFTSVDIAPACCGAAAVVITSDLAVVERALATWSRARYRAAPILEVLGVGEGVANPDISYRRSPMAYLAPMRQALASAASDSGLSLAAFQRAAFAVLHDAFPSIELGFLLAMGFGWEQALGRMAGGWSNPYGGLLGFGHALGASGLVQIAKTFHILAGDRRYVPSDEGASFPIDGSLAITSSVGGPLSHLVVSVFRGGAEHPSALFERPGPEARGSKDEALRRDARRRAGEFRERLHRGLLQFDPEAKRTGTPTTLRYIEGITEIDLRSCLHTLPEGALRRFDLRGAVASLEESHRSAALDDLLAALEALRLELRAGSSSIASAYDSTVGAVVQRWSATGAVAPGSEQATAGIVKAALRVSLALLPALPADRPTSATREIVWLEALAPFVDARFLRRDGAFGVPVALPTTAVPSLLPAWESGAVWPPGGPLGGPFELAEDRAVLAPASHPARHLGPSVIAELLMTLESASLDESEHLVRVSRAALGWLAHAAVTMTSSGVGVRVTALTPEARGGELCRDVVRFAVEVLTQGAGRSSRTRFLGVLTEIPQARLDSLGAIIALHDGDAELVELATTLPAANDFALRACPAICAAAGLTGSTPEGVHLLTIVHRDPFAPGSE